jgi:predicted ABC-type ATPase
VTQSVDDKLFHEVITNALDVERLKAGEARNVVKMIAAMAQELSAELEAGELSGLRRSEVEKFLKNASEIIRQHYTDIAELSDFSSISATVQHATASSLEMVLGIDAVSLPSKFYTNSVNSNVMIEGSPTADWWRGQAENVVEQFVSNVRLGLTAGETNEQITRRIVGSSGEAGILDVATRDARTLVHSSIQTVANDARRKTFEANSDIIKGIKQVSTLDGHTTIICVSYSGASWNLDYEPINGNDLPYNGGAPRHWNCRSAEVPITKTFAELGLAGVKEPPVSTRASVDGQIAGDTTFEGFLRGKSIAFQDELLGAGRAELWRSGKITLRDLVSGEGNPLTLSELMAKYGFSSKTGGFSAEDFMKRFDDPNATAASILAKFPSNTKAKILEVEAKISKLTPTSALYSKAGVYTSAREKLHQDILYKGVNGFDPKTSKSKFYPPLISKAKLEAAITNSDKPTFTILGGRGGSGKSAFDGQKFPQAKVYDKDKVILFDSDVIKHMLPEFRGFNANQVHEESSDILRMAIEEAKQHRANIVLDGTLKSRESALSNVHSFIDAGYKVEAHYMHLPRQEAAARAIARFLGPTGRYVSADIILGNIQNEETFDEIIKLVDEWSFRDNNVPRGEPPRLIASKRKHV